MNTPAGKLSRMEMGQHPDSGRWLGRVFALWQIACGMAALVMLGLACVPLDSLREYGGLIRRPEDVSLERFTRFQQVCWFLTASLASLSAGAWIGQRGVTDFLRRLWRPTTDEGMRALAVSCSLSPTSDSQPAEEQVAGERVEVREPHGPLKPPHPGHLPHSAVHSESHAAWGGEGADRADDCQLANAPATDESPTPSRSPHQDAHGYGWLAFILCVGAALRLSLLSMPMAYDESYSWINFASRPLPQALGDLNSTNNHLFNTFCMFVTGRLFGPQEWALRIGVMCCGLATLPVGFVWARRWMGTPTALLTTALLAVSPLLVTYSADARGYEYMMLAAVLLDDALAKLASRQGRSERSWVQAGLAVVLGVWSMIIMGYAILASVLWYVLSGGHSGSVALRSAKERSDAERTAPLGATLRKMVLLGWLTAIGSSLIYIPGYICRGTLFLNDPVMRQATSDSWEFLAETRQGLVGAWDFWTEGAIPASVMGVAVLAGLWSWPRDRSSRLRLLSPFVVVVALNFVRHVNPPPRIYLWLMPWVCLLTARGVVWGTSVDEGSTRGHSRAGARGPRAGDLARDQTMAGPAPFRQPPQLHLRPRGGAASATRGGVGSHRIPSFDRPASL